jgi:hypothetical protein
VGGCAVCGGDCCGGVDFDHALPLDFLWQKCARVDQILRTAVDGERLHDCTTARTLTECTEKMSRNIWARVWEGAARRFGPLHTHTQRRCMWSECTPPGSTWANFAHKNCVARSPKNERGSQRWLVWACGQLLSWFVGLVLGPPPASFDRYIVSVTCHTSHVTQRPLDWTFFVRVKRNRSNQMPTQPTSSTSYNPPQRQDCKQPPACASSQPAPRDPPAPHELKDRNITTPLKHWLPKHIALSLTKLDLD